MGIPHDVALQHWVYAMRTLPLDCRFPLVSDYAALMHASPLSLTQLERIFLLDVTSSDLYDRLPVCRADTYRLANARGHALHAIWMIVSAEPLFAGLSMHIRLRARQLVRATRVLASCQTY